MGIDAQNQLSFSTKRLSVRALSTSDAALERDLTSILTQSVLEHLPPPLQSVTSENAWINARLAECEVMTVSYEGTVIGLIFLARNGTEMHLGYLLAQSAWGKGFASELISVLIAELAKTNVTRVIGGVARNNPASAKVLLKNGFKLASTQASKDGDEDSELYEWTPLSS